MRKKIFKKHFKKTKACKIFARFFLWEYGWE